MSDMENFKVDIEAGILRDEIEKLHKDWAFDSKRYQECKEENKQLKYDYNNLEKLYKQLQNKYNDLLEDFNEFRNKLEYCRDCQI